MPEVNVENVRVVVEGELRGDGVPIIAMHGAGGGAYLWRLMREPLGLNAPLLAVDLPGHGASEGDGYSSVADYLRVVRGIAKGLGAKRPIAMGNSMGGAIALDWALNYPDELSGLVLVGTGARLRVKPAIFDSINENYQGYLQGLEKVAFGPNPPQEGMKIAQENANSATPDTTFNDFKACDNFDIMEDLSKIHLPTLVLCGDADLLTPIKYSEYLERVMPRAQLKVFPGAGHMLPLERPRQAADAIIEWLKSV